MVNYYKGIGNMGKILGGNNNPFFSSNPKTSKRSLSVKDKHILFDLAKHRCQNPYCRKPLTESEMQIGHKQAYSRKGATTIKNSVCLCYACNRKQGTDNWVTFLRKQEHAKHQGDVKRPKRTRPTKSRSRPKNQQPKILSINEILGGPSPFRGGI